MKSQSHRTALYALLVLLWAARPLGVLAAESMKEDPSYAGLQGNVLLDNQRVLVQKFVLQPGQSTGRHSHPADQLLVFIKGGVLRSPVDGRRTRWREGRVVWQGAAEPADEGVTNSGNTPITMDLVTFKPVARTADVSSGGKRKYQYLNYPNVPGEDLLENDSVIVQRFSIGPGQWEGVHAHCPDMLYVHVKGGQWSAKTYTEPETPSPNFSPDGEAGWMPTTDISVGHQSRNIGKTPIDLVWVTLKK